MRDSRLDIPASSEAAANLLKKHNPVLQQVSPVIIPESYETVDSTCKLTIHPWNDQDEIQVSLWMAVCMHSWLLEASRANYTVSPFKLEGKPFMWKDGHTVRIAGFPRQMSTDTILNVIKRIGEEVHQIKQTSSALINF